MVNKTNIVEILGKRIDNLHPLETELFVTASEWDLYADFFISNNEPIKPNSILTLDGKKLVIKGKIEDN